jgi:Domain of unknown function (DUF4124)
VKGLAALIGALALGSAGLGEAQDIYKWKDDQGRTHYSNHGGSTGNDSAGANSDTSEQGWESVLEKQKGKADFQEKAEAVINDLQLQLIRKKRDRAQAQEALEATQASIVRSQATGGADVPMLRAHEATQSNDLRRIDAEIAAMGASTAKLRAVKAAEQEQRSGQ